LAVKVVHSSAPDAEQRLRRVIEILRRSYDGMQTKTSEKEEKRGTPAHCTKRQV